ncbi:MAG: MbnP family protein [Emticicia sp.]|nr:MbnP family protein [Emticicia sp.]
MKAQISKLLIAIFCAIAGISCEKNDVENQPTATENIATTGQITLKFDNVVGDKDLKYNTSYTNSVTGENFEVFSCQYYISNIKLKTDEGKEVVIPQDSSYFFVSEASQNSQNIKLSKIPFGNYTELSFVIGVDSTRSSKGIETAPKGLMAGVSQGMYWTWNSGYIFFMLEGTSPMLKGNAAGNDFMYHVGGYNSTNINNIKTKSVKFDKAVVSTTKTPEIKLKMDILKVFNGNTNIKFTQNTVVMFEPFSKKIADNYVNAFSVDSIINQ